MNTLLRAALGSLFATLLVPGQDVLEARVKTLLMSDVAGRPAALRALVASEPPIDAFIAAARRMRADRDPSLGSGWNLLEATDADGTTHPYQLFLPDRFAGAADGLPLLICLHGAVARPEFSRTPGRVGATGQAWSRVAAERGFPVAYPLGRRDCPWWSAAGVGAIRAVIRDVQRRLPVDPARIVGTGFSDGGSGCYYLAMKAPDPFAAFLPLNGHPRVASAASGEQLYLRNLRGMPLFVAMTRDDVLYPAADVMRHLQPLIGANADLHLVIYPFGNHTPAYFEEQKEVMTRFFLEARRDPRPDRIAWMGGIGDRGRRAWLAVEKTGKGHYDGEDRPDWNVPSSPGRVRLGVRVTEAEAGLLVDEVTGGSVAARMKLRPGDRLLAVDEQKTPDLAALRAALAGKEHGQAVLVSIRRGSESLVLFGRIPPFVPRPVYRRDRGTAWIEARMDPASSALRVQSLNVRGLRLYVDAPWVPKYLLGPDRGPSRPGVRRRGHGLVQSRARALEEIATEWGRRPLPDSLATHVVTVEVF